MQIIKTKGITALIITVITCVTMFPFTVFAEDSKTFLREDFNDLKEWEPLYFKKIKEYTVYSISGEDGGVLRAESEASASGLVYKREFNVYEYPRVRWRWKVSNVYKAGDAGKKSGDDYPIRIYIMFKYDPGNASFSKKVKYAVARRLYGKYPPHGSINYIWANKRHDERVITNSYASEAMMVPLQYGDADAGKWKEQSVDVLSDYRDAFGEDPPSIASLALMNDSDNTKESSISYIDFIEVFR